MLFRCYDHSGFGFLVALAVALVSLPSPAQTLRRGTLEPQSLDVYQGEYLFEQIIDSDLYEGLIVFAPGGELRGGAAQSWDISPDGTVYTFRLRPGLRWSNGDSLTADDFVRGFRHLVDPSVKSPYAFLAAPVRGIEAVANDVVRITLTAPTAYFLAALTSACFAPMHPKGGAIGNGAYILEEWSHGKRIVLKRNPQYWNAAHVQIAEVQYIPMPDVSKELEHYLAGDLDITWDVPADRIVGLRASRPTELHIIPHFGLYYFAFDLSRPPFRENVKLRQALAMAIDRERLTREVTGGGELPAYGWVPPGLPGYDNQVVDWQRLSQDERRSKARLLFAEAGYGQRRRLRIVIHHISTEARRKICQAIIAQWKEVLGVEGTVTADDLVQREAADPAVGHVIGTGWNADYADANSFLEIWKSDATVNVTGYRNDEYDSLVRRASRERSPGNRVRMLEEAERALLHDLPAIPLFDSVLKKLVRPSVHGYAPNVLGFAYTKDLSIVAK